MNSACLRSSLYLFGLSLILCNRIIRLLSQELDIHARGSSIIYLHRFPVYLSNGKNPTRCHQVPSRSYGTYLLAGANPGSTEWRAEQWGEYTEIE